MSDGSEFQVSNRKVDINLANSGVVVSHSEDCYMHWIRRPTIDGDEYWPDME